VKNREIDALRVEFGGSEAFAEWFRPAFAGIAAA
jgi:hypothetical protein